MTHAQARPAFAAGEQRASRAPAGRRFLITALLWMGVLYGAYYYPYAPGSAASLAIETYLRLLSQASGWLIGLFDAGVRVSDTLIVGRFSLRIVKSCSSLDAQALYVAAVLAFPSQTKLKLTGLLLGIALLSALNLARISALYFVGAQLPEAFDAVHEELFPLLLVVAAAGAFATWAGWASRDGSRRTV